MRFFGLLPALISVLRAQPNEEPVYPIHRSTYTEYPQYRSYLFEEEATGLGSERNKKKTEAFYLLFR